MAEFIEVDGRDVGDIKVYALSTCGWCKKAKALLNEHNIRYAFVDVDRLAPDELDPIRAEQRKHNPSGSFPTIVVDGECIVGYDEERLMALTRR